MWKSGFMKKRIFYYTVFLLFIHIPYSKSYFQEGAISDVSCEHCVEVLLYTEMMDACSDLGLNTTHVVSWECSPIPPGDFFSCSGEYYCCQDGFCVGDPHLTTFDGLFYDFQAVGEFILVNGSNFNIQVRLEQWGNSRISVVTAVAMMVGNDRIGIYLNKTNPLRINGEVYVFDCGGEIQLDDGGLVRLENSVYTIIDPENAFQVTVTDFRTHLDVTPRICDKEGMTGLLGNGDGDPDNDLITRDGRTISQPPTYNEFYGEFGNSWRIQQSESLFDYGEFENTETFTDLDFPYGSFTWKDLSPEIQDWAREICQEAGITDPILLNACILDVGITGDPSFADSFVNVSPHVKELEIVSVETRLMKTTYGGCSCSVSGNTGLLSLGIGLIVLAVLRRRRSKT